MISTNRPITVKPIIIKDMYTLGTAIAKYKFRSNVNTMIFDMAKGEPPYMSSRVTSFVFKPYPFPNDVSNNMIDGIPDDILYNSFHIFY